MAWVLLGAGARAAEVADGWQLRRWGPEDGLPVVGINSLERDEIGYIWLATFDGLVRFDGVRFEAVELGDQLPSRRLTTLWRGRYGGLWFSTETFHLGRYDSGSGKAVKLGDGVRSIRRGPDGEILAAMGSCLFRETPHGLGPAEACLDGEVLRSFAEDDNDTLWLGALGGGLFRKPAGGELEQVAGIPEDAAVTALAPDREGGLWVGTSRGLLHLGESAESVPLGDVDVEIVRIESTADGLWIATMAGLYELDGPHRAHRASRAQPTGSEPLRFKYIGGRWTNLGHSLVHKGVEVLKTESLIRDVLSDPEGNLWVATGEEGLLRLRPSSLAAVVAVDGAPLGPVYPIVEDRAGDIWLGLHGLGLARVRDGRAEILSGSDGLAPDYVWSILPLGPEELLLGGRGLWRYSGGRFIPASPEALATEVVRALYRDEEGREWVGTKERGIFMREAGGDWQHLARGLRGLPFAAVQAFLDPGDDSLWIATNGAGLVRWSATGFESLSRQQGFPSDALRALWQDPAGDLWVGTEDRGLLRVRLASDASLADAELTLIDRSRGLYTDGVHRILPDGHGRLWMSSNRGIFRVSEDELLAVANGDAKRLHCVAYTEADGLPSREANGGVQSAGMRASDGRLWFPTVEGAAILDPAHLPDNPVPPPVVIEAVRSAGQGDVVPLPTDDTPLRLGPEQRTFEVEYTALAFAAPERVRFRVSMEGLTRDWLDLGDQRRMLFTDLPPGPYEFRVQAANEHGVWSPVGASLAIYVVPRWWETRVAHGGLLALLLVAVGAAWVWRLRRHRARERRLEDLVDQRTVDLADALQRTTQQSEALREADEAKSRFFAHLSHELRTPLTLLASPLLDAEPDPDRLADEAPVMRRAVQSLSRMVEQILDLEKAEAGHLVLATEPRDLAELAARVVDGFAGLAGRWGLELTCATPPPGPVAAIDLEHMERVLANLVSNALRFTPAGGRVTVAVWSAGDEAILEVADTGQGIPAEALSRIFDRFYQVGFEGFEPGRTRGTGIGLALVRELAELHGGRVTVDSEPDRGSTFRVHLPSCSEDPQPLDDMPAVVLDPPEGRSLDSEPSATTDSVTDSMKDAEDGSDEPRRTVLVVDDHPEIRRALCRLLGTDYRTVSAPDGRAGLRLTRRLLPDLVVADVSMPELDGFEMARRLAADPETAGIPLVFLTARATAADELEGFAAGAVGYVRKPFAGDALRARVASLLHQQRGLAERLRRLADRDREDDPAPADLGVRARRAILEHLDDESFGPSDLATALAVSRSQLFARCRAELDTTPAELLRAVRLERGRELLADSAGTVSEVAYAIGFTSLSSFSRAYRARYGEPPSAALGRRASESTAP